MRALLALMLCGPVFAQSALPSMEPSSPLAPHYYVSKTGGCVWWYIDKGVFTPENQTGFEFAAYCANESEFAKAGARMQTIMRAADPLKSLQTLRNRIDMSRMDCGRRPPFWPCRHADQNLSAIVEEMNAARDK